MKLTNRCVSLDVRFCAGQVVAPVPPILPRVRRLSSLGWTGNGGASEVPVTLVGDAFTVVTPYWRRLLREVRNRAPVAVSHGPAQCFSDPWNLARCS